MDSRTEDLFSFQRKCLQVMGMWPLAIERHLPKSVVCLATPLQHLFEGLMLLLGLHIAILQAKTTYDNFGGNLDDLSDSLTATIIYSFVFFASVYFMWSRRLLVELVDFINSNHRECSAVGLTHVKGELAVKRARIMSMVWIISCLLGVITWALYPLATGQRALPLRCWYPLDEKKPIIYETLYVIQFFAQLQVGLVFGNGSAVYISFIIVVCGQYDVLFCSFKNIINTAHFKSGQFSVLRKQQSQDNSTDDELNQYLYCKEEKYDLDTSQTLLRQRPSQTSNFEVELKEAIKKCVQHHQFILTVCKLLEKFYNGYCLIKSLQITIQLCLLAFVAVNTTTSFFKALSLGQYLILTMIELLMFTVYGQILTSQSLRVGEAALRSSWYLKSASLRTDYLIILPNTLRPVILSAGKFFVMDVDRLRNVVTSAFSFLTLLQNLRE